MMAGISAGQIYSYGQHALRAHFNGESKLGNGRCCYFC